MDQSAVVQSILGLIPAILSSAIKMLDLIMEHTTPLKMMGAPPMVSLVCVLLAHLASGMLAFLLPTTTKLSSAEQELAAHIKDLVREANLLSTPSTFAKAAKLKRIAAAKERELAQLRHTDGKGQRLSFSWHAVISKILQTSMYLFLAYWYWGHPLLTVPSRSIHPLDNTLSWNSWSCQRERNFIKIGILPWLLVCSRVGMFLSKKAFPQ